MGAERVDYFGQIRVSSAAGSTSVESNHVNVWLGNGHQDYPFLILESEPLSTVLVSRPPEPLMASLFGKRVTAVRADTRRSIKCMKMY